MDLYNSKLFNSNLKLQCLTKIKNGKSSICNVVYINYEDKSSKSIKFVSSK